MNKTRIKASIAQMKRATKLNMEGYGFLPSDGPINEKALHTCGNSACWAGYTSVSSFFRRAGGRLYQSTCDFYSLIPVYGGLSGDEAMAKFFGISEPLAMAIVSGVQHPLYNSQGAKLWAEKSASNIRGRSLTGVSWKNAKPKHIIKILEAILAGELK